MKTKLFFLFFVFFLLATAVTAYMPETHEYLNDRGLEKAGDNKITQIIKENKQDFQSCTLLADISVFYYFNEGFNSIGKEYKATHSVSLCLWMVENAENDAQLACAYGLCSHLIADSTSHNLMIPMTIEDAKMPNAVMHVFSEEKVNDNILRDNPEYGRIVREALIAKAPVHKEFFREGLTRQDSNFKFDEIYDAFVRQVTSDSSYSVGFMGFSAIPMQIHLILIMFALFSIGLIVYFVKKQLFNAFAKGLIIFILIMLALVGFIYVSYAQGSIWKVFQTVSNPVSSITPVHNEQEVLTLAENNLAQFYTRGTSYMYSVADPAGNEAIGEANSNVVWVSYLVALLLFLAMAFVVWRAIRGG